MINVILDGMHQWKRSASKDCYRVQRFYDADSILEWKAPWVYAKDMLGEDFRDRMRYRLDQGKTIR